MPMDTTGGMPVDTTQGPAPVDSTLTSCPNVTLGADRTICEGDSIQLNAVAGQGTFSWITTGNISCTDCQQPTIRPLESTMYIVNSTTLAGCTTSDTIFITVSEVPLIDTILQVVPTACQTDGSITIQIADNTSTFQYSIDNGASFQPTSSFNNLGGGIYPVQVRNASNCTLPTARTITLEDNSPIRVDSVLVSNPNDCQNELGNIMAMVTLQDSVMAQYSVDSGATWVNRANFDSLDAGTYHLLVRTVDSSCVINYQNNPIQLIRPDTARIISGLADRSFCEEDTKSIRVILNQAIDGFTIEGGQFMNADTEGDTLTFEPVFAGATATYAVMLTGNSGCSTIDSFQIAVISCADIEACGFFNGLDTLRAEFTDSIAEVCVPISNMDIEEFQFIQDREIVDITFGQCNDASIFYRSRSELGYYR